MDRQDLIKQIALNILKIQTKYPVKVAIDGITASGKTTFANELASSLESMGKLVHRVSLDGFHNPKAIRYKRGKTSPKGYYFDAYNYPAIIEHLLSPLSENGACQYRTQVLDLDTDKESFPEEIEMPENGILIVDGSFSLRRELYDYWDYAIYLSVDMENAEKRAGDRDQGKFGSRELAMETTKFRYHFAHFIHNELESPMDKADIVVDNNLPEKAFILKDKGRATNLTLPVFSMERVCLRPLEITDIENLKSLDIDPDVVKYLGHGNIRKEEETRLGLKRHLTDYKKYGLGLYAIEDKSSGEFMGRAGLIPWVIDKNLHWEIGYTLKKEYWGKGLATEIATFLRDWAARNLNTDYVLSLINPENEKSIAVAKKIGMKFWKEIDVSNYTCSAYRMIFEINERHNL